MWRNKRRTILTCSAIAFATVLIQLGMSFQVGSYGPMIEGATRFGSGHIQIQHQDYKDEPKLDLTIPSSKDFLTKLANFSGITSVSARSESFALLNNDEKSYGAMIIGVDATSEAEVSYLPRNISEGDYLPTSDSAYAGATLAKNLGLKLGDEIVLLSHDNLGGIAASVPILSGIFASGNDQLDRTLIQIPLETFNDVFRLENDVHRIVIMVENPLDLDATKKGIERILPPSARVYDWRELMPEISQNIRLDKISNGIIYGILTIIVVLSIANTFVMSIFERTREFGTLRAIGMKNFALFRMFLTESIILWLLGISIGIIVSILGNLPLAHYGIALSSLGVDQLAGQFYLPDRLYPRIDINVLLVAPLALGAGICLTSMFAAARMYRITLIHALRFKE